MNNWEDGYTFEMYERDISERERRYLSSDDIWDYVDIVIKEYKERND